MAWADLNPFRIHRKPVVEVEQPEVVAMPAPVSHIYVRERGTAVFIPFAVFPESFKPEDHGGMMAADTAVLRIELPVPAVLGMLENANCLRGLVDAEIKAIREMRRLEVDREFLEKHLRDK